MISFISIMAMGLFLGMRHATDADHVIAISAIVSQQRKVKRAAWTGIFWGIGHSLTIFVVGALIIVLGVVIPTRVGLSMEFSVALMLVFLGAMNISSFFRSLPFPPPLSHKEPEMVHSQVHGHGHSVHTQLHGHSPEDHLHSPQQRPLTRRDRLFVAIGLYRHVRPLVVGIIHGLAGSAAVALLVLATIRNPRWAVAYLLVFGAGTVAGMVLITLSIASALTFLSQRSKMFSHGLGLASGLLSLVFGLAIACHIGFGTGLFSSHPQWIPR